MDRDEIGKRLRSMPHRKRIAVVARLLGTSAPVYGGWQNADPEILQEILAMLWSYAGGAGIDADDALSLRDDLSDNIPDISEDPGLSAVMNAGVAALYAIDALSDLSAEYAVRAIVATIQANLDAGGDAAEDASIDLVQSSLDQASRISGTTAAPADFL